MLAYLRLIVREACKFGGNGWITYDAVFRRNQVGRISPWNYIDASLHQIYIANQPGKVIVPCKHCFEIDHTSADCAVAAVLREGHPGTQSSGGPERTSAKGKRPAPYSRQRPICSSWNSGSCKFPGKCAYAHVCSNCYGSHQATACRERPFPGSPSSARLQSGPTSQ